MPNTKGEREYGNRSEGVSKPGSSKIGFGLVDVKRHLDLLDDEAELVIEGDILKG